jgi:hypothetical protein|tara:strand:- start:3659 stop:4279 length:621 start_codon:yes stop_codon:yes gene_type:complete
MRLSLFFNLIKLFLESMINTKLLLYECKDIYEILNELNDFLKLDLNYVNSKNDLDLHKKSHKTFLIISKKKENHINEIVFDKLPISIEKLLEKINLSTLKANYSQKSDISIGKYSLNLNSREIFYKKKSLKLTEQEVKILMYLNDCKSNKSVEVLQKDIWGYSLEVETHTVETHIHRLRKKFLSIFNDKDLILSTKEGYFIQKFKF